GSSSTSWPRGADIPVRVAEWEACSSLIWLGVGCTNSGPISGVAGATAVGITTGVGTAGADGATAGADATTRGPEGSSESRPRPNALLFSAGLCSSTAAISPLLIYIVSRYITLAPKPDAQRRYFKSIVTSLFRSRQRRQRGAFVAWFSAPAATDCKT